MAVYTTSCVVALTRTPSNRSPATITARTFACRAWSIRAKNVSRISLRRISAFSGGSTESIGASKWMSAQCINFKTVLAILYSFGFSSFGFSDSFAGGLSATESLPHDKRPRDKQWRSLSHRRKPPRFVTRDKQWRSLSHEACHALASERRT